MNTIQKQQGWIVSGDDMAAINHIVVQSKWQGRGIQTKQGIFYNHIKWCIIEMQNV